MKFCLKCMSLVCKWSLCHRNTLDWSQDETHGGNAGQIWCLYKHIENVLAYEKKKIDKATLQGKKRKLLEATTLCCTAFFLDNLETAKMFSLVSQKKDINILTITDILEDTRSWSGWVWGISYPKKTSLGKNDKILVNGQSFLWFSKTIFPGYFHSLKSSIFYLLCFHKLRYKYEAALSVYS